MWFGQVPQVHGIYGDSTVQMIKRKNIVVEGFKLCQHCHRQQFSLFPL